MPKENHKAAGLLALSFAVVLWLCPVPCAFGGPLPTDGSGSGVVFAVETSAATATADPNGLLTHALKLSAALLGQDDQFGLITFNEKAAATIQKITPADKKTTIYKAIDSIGKLSSDNASASSNPYNALSNALSEFSRDNTSLADRFVVFVGASKTYATPPEEDKKIHGTILNELVPLFKDKGVRLFTVSLGAMPEGDFMQELAEKTGGFSFTCPQPTSLNATVTSIYETIKAPDILPAESGRFAVDESIDRLTIVFSKKTPEFKLILQDPDGYNYSAQKGSPGISWTQFFNFDIVTISGPVAGEWNFMSVDDANNKIYVSTHLKVRTNVKSSYQQVNTQMKVDAWLTLDDLIIDIGELANTIAITGSLTGPDGDNATVKLKLRAPESPSDKNGSTRGGGVLSEYFTLKTIGIYKLTISVKSKTIERSKSFLIAATAMQDSHEEKTDSTEKQFAAGKKPYKATAWLNRYVSHAPSALNKALKWFIAINMVLFLSVLLYIKRNRLAKIKFSDIKMPKIKMPKVKLPDMKLVTKYFRKSKETHDQD
ncbi:MAG: VWA domain-containing protein [Nitrospirae bacterium]|nr:VWA domain-containing protein [Nitrospirota bacterium]